MAVRFGRGRITILQNRVVAIVFFAAGGASPRSRETILGNDMKTLKQEKLGKTIIRLVENRGEFTGLVIYPDEQTEQYGGRDQADIWVKLKAAACQTAGNFHGYQGARTRFLELFPDGFSGAAYLSHERDYKLAAANDFCASMPLDQMDDGVDAEVALKAFRATNLLSPFEKTRVSEVLRGPHSIVFLKGAAMFANGAIKDGLAAMRQASEPYEAAKWTVVTYLPYLWRPDQHMFLKPEVSKEYAERVGHPFQYDYAPTLAPEVYVSLLDMAAETMANIGDLEPADFMDVQSFIWSVGRYKEESAVEVLT